MGIKLSSIKINKAYISVKDYHKTHDSSMSSVKEVTYKTILM